MPRPTVSDQRTVDPSAGISSYPDAASRATSSVGIDNVFRSRTADVYNTLKVENFGDNAHGSTSACPVIRVSSRRSHVTRVHVVPILEAGSSTLSRTSVAASDAIAHRVQAEVQARLHALANSIDPARGPSSSLCACSVTFALAWIRLISPPSPILALDALI